MKHIIATTVLAIGCLAGFSQPKPGKPAFIVNYEESGKNVNESWSYTGVVKFSLSNWSEPLRGKGYTPEERKLPLEFDPGAFLNLHPGAVVKFYPSEVDEAGSGTNGSYTRFLGTDGVETTVETTDQGTRSIVTDDASFRKGNGIPTNEVYSQNARYYQLGELAELERTATGAILRAYTAIGNNLSEWAVSLETEEQVFPKVYEFVLTDAEIRSWKQISKSNRGSGSSDDDNLSVTVAVKMEVPDLEKPEVFIEGCSEMGIGEQGQLTATGKPGGGTYRFRVEPSDILSVSSSGSAATLTGSSPGRGTIYVEYTGSDGQTAQVTKTAACLKIDSYNGGQPIPQVAFYDFDGKRLTGINVPVSIQPSDGADLLKYVPADPGILTVTGLGNEVVIQGIRQGKTTFQATTHCGGTTGPVVEVEVVNCDDETRAKLDEQARIANERLKELMQQMERMVNSEEYKRAHDRILESTAELALKTSTLILGTLGGLPGADKAVTTASKISGLGSSLLDLLRSGNNVEQAANMVKMSIEVFGDNVQQGVSGTFETLEAAKNFGDDLGGMEKAAQETADIYNSLDQLKRFIDNLSYRMRLCASDTDQGASQEEPAGDPSQNRNDPSPKTDKPPVKEPTAEEPAAEEARGEDPAGENPAEQKTGDDGTEISPPPPTSEPKQVSLPFMPSDECGCKNPKEIGLSQEGFLSLKAGMTNLGTCVDNFTKGPLTDYLKTLEEWKSVTDSLAISVSSGPSGFQTAAKETIPRIESLLQRTQSFDTAGQAFIGEFNSCSGSMNSVMEVLRNAETVTIDSIKTNY